MSENVFKSTQPNPPQQTLENLSNAIGYDIPVNSVPLPSKGLAYPLDHPFSNEERVEIKALTAREEDILTSPALIKNGTAISRVIQSCLLNKAVDPDDLLVGDRNALLIAIRSSGYGSTYSAKVMCPECDEKFDKDFSLELELKPLGAEPLQSNVNLFTFQLPVTKKEVTFKLLTGREESELGAESKRKRKLGSKVTSSVTSRLLKCIVSVGAESDPHKLSKFIVNMLAGDSSALRKHIDKISPDVNMNQNVLCPHCDEESEVKIPLGIGFLWPDLG